jgi:Galactose oxidase, central domain
MRGLVWALVAVTIVSGLGISSASAHSAPASPTSTSTPVSGATVALAAATASLTFHHWTQLSPATHPSNRDQVQMAYDPSTSEVVLFGGYRPLSSAPLNDTWIFHAGNWTNVTSTAGTAPPSRWAGGFAYDLNRDALVLFGGRDLTRFFNDTWVFNGTAWKHVHTGPAPSRRSGVSLTYDARDGYLLLFGGGIGNLPAGSGSAWTYYNETWTFSGNTWTNRTSTVGNAPSPRFAMASAYDPTTAAVLFVGGEALSSGVSSWQNDTWTFSAGSWRAVATAISPPPEYGPAMTWDTKLGEAILFGQNSSGNFDPTYAFHSVTWKNLTISTSTYPGERGNMGLAFDKADGYVVLFGGDTPTSFSYWSDTWTFA